MATQKTKISNEIIKAALALYRIGWIPFPLVPGSNDLAVDWEQWQADLSANWIRRYWRNHPDHGLGFVEAPDNTDTSNL